MEIDSKLKFITAILVIIATIGGFFAVSNHYQLNIGGTVNNIFNNFQSSDSSQANPPAVPTATLTAPPKPASASDVGSSDQNTATAPPDPPPESTQPTVSFHTPTPPPTPKPTPTIDLPFGVIATNSFTTTGTSQHTYKIVLPETGRLTIAVSNGDTYGVKTLNMNLDDSNGKSVKYASTTSLPSTLYPYIRVDLDAGTYYFVVTRTLYTGTYNVQADFVPF